MLVAYLKRPHGLRLDRLRLRGTLRRPAQNLRKLTKLIRATQPVMAT